MNVGELFNAAASEYDAARPRLIPCFEEFYGTALELIPFERDAEFKVLDLGAGTGLLAAIVHEAFPHAHVTLTDIAPAMLDIARNRFAGKENLFEFRIEDYLHEPLSGQYDVVLSGLSLHHTPHEQLPEVFAKIFGTLKPGGIFVNADQALGVTPENEAMIEAMWVKGCWGRGATEAEIEGAKQRMKADLTAPLESQLGWMRSVGFTEVECWFKAWRFVVYSGKRP